MDREFVVVVTDTESPCGAKAMELAAAWTAADLLSPSLWIDRAAWSSSTLALAVLLGNEGAEEVAVQGELSRRSVGSLRVVSLHLAPDEQSARHLPSGEDEWEIHRVFRRRAADADIPFKGGVVAVAAVDVAVPENVFYPKFAFNLLVVDEDRISDTQMAHDADEARLVPHAVGALAVLAGMGSWVTRNPVDATSAAQGGNTARVQVARTYLRVVDGGHVLDDIVDAALQRDECSGRWPLPSGVSPPPTTDEEPAGAIRALTSRFADHFNLRFAPYRARPLDPPVRMGIRAGLRLFLRSVGAIARGAPSWFVRIVVDQVDRSVLGWFQAHVFGVDSQVVLTLRGRDHKGTGAQPATDGYRVIRDLQMPGTEVVVAEPDLWEGFRAVGCGLADAGPMPDGLTPMRTGTARALVPLPEFVAPDAGDRFSHRTLDSDIAACDPLRARAVASALMAAVRDTTGLEAEAGPSPLALAPAEAEECLAALDAWTAQDHRAESYAWQVGCTLADSLEAASGELADAMAVIAEGPPADGESEQDRARRRAFRTFLLVSAAAVAVVIVGTGLAFTADEAPPARTAGIGLLLLLGVCAVVLYKFLAYAYATARAQFQRARKVHEYFEAVNRAHVAAVGITRFSSLYWQYLDWVAVLGTVLYRPWGTRQERRVGYDIEGLERPLAAAFARATVSPDGFQRRVAGARDVVVTRGWLWRALDAAVSRSMGRYAVITNAQRDEPPNPFFDVSLPGTIVSTHAATGEPIKSPRAQAAHDIVSGRFTVEARRAHALDIADHFLREPVDELFTTVEVGEEAQRVLSGTDASTFLAGIAPGEGHARAPFPMRLFADIGREHGVEASHVAVPPGVGDGPGSTPTEARAEYGRALRLAAHRLDVSRGYAAAELRTTGSPAAEHPGQPTPEVVLDF